MTFFKNLAALILFSMSTLAIANVENGGVTSAHMLNLSATVYGMIALIVFICAYLLVIGEEFLHLRKSKPVIIAAGIIWVLVAMAYMAHGDNETAGILLRNNIFEFAELMLFLLAAMTYINTMQDRNIFAALRGVIVSRGFSYRTVFWITGLLAFFISPVADNLTTALVMAAVVMAIAQNNKAFVTIGCINIVVAANAGGAFSPFGDITTLMVWQRGLLRFEEFFALFVPSVINWLVPALIMSFFIPHEIPQKADVKVEVKTGGFITVALFITTIVLAVSVHNFFHLPPVLGMMTGLGLLKLYGYFLKRKEQREWDFIS
jgi:Na+/H+ antiporter NhaD/arsenite permease-like protein